MVYNTVGGQCTEWALATHREWLLENDLHWTSVQELFEAKLEPAIQSIVLALIRPK